MISYLDTSIAVKIYVIEQGTAEAKAAVAGSSVVATSRIAYAEAMAAFARKLRQREFTAKGYQQVCRDFRSDWKSFFIVEVSQQTVELAAELAERRRLRGFDAIHLASALQLQQRTNSRLDFYTADLNLQKAARSEGLKTGKIGTI
jgi:predicted nucleic acid-binding protein